MKIIILSYGPSGMLHYALDLVNELSHGNDIYLFTTEKYVEEQFLFSKCNVIFISPNKIQDIKMKIDIINPDIIHITAFHYSLFALLFFLKKRKTVYTVHDAKSHPYSSIWKNIKLKILINQYTQRFLYSHVSKVICLSAYVAGQVNMKYGITAPVIYLKNEKEKFKQDMNMNIDKKINVLCFGTLAAYKGQLFIEEFISYLETQQASDIKLVIAGKQNSEFVQKYSTLSFVHLINKYVDDREIFSLFSTVNIVLLPYTEVSQSGILALALSFQKMCITPNLGSFNEYALAYPKLVRVLEEFTPEIVYHQCMVYNHNDFYLPKRYETFYSMLLNDK
uniref:glycosyltransferase n=1 Tax=Bacteroides nordii TaxID=291645 RepID=UPI002A812BDE|nr:glycosyltransferase [Bacteroides nordii]